MAISKTKICVSLDLDLVEVANKLAADRAGGFSRWVNEACKKELNREKRRKGYSPKTGAAK